MQRLLLAILIGSFVANCAPVEKEAAYDAAADTLRYEQEKYIRNIQQLTFGANNAEAYWSFDDSKIILQSDNAGSLNDIFPNISRNRGMLGNITKRSEMLDTCEYYRVL